MKFTREEKPFKQISLTIETKQEAQLFWHVFNCDVRETMYDYIIDSNVDIETMKEFIETVFLTFDKLWSE